MDIEKEHERFIQKLIDEINNHDLISKRNKDWIIGFFNEKIINGRKISGMGCYLRVLKRLCEYYEKDLDILTKSEIIDFFVNYKPEKIVLNTKSGSYVTEIEEYSPTSLNLYKTSLKTFYIWLAKETKIERDEKGIPIQVSWIKQSSKIKCKRPKDILTREEIYKMIKVASNPRDKAIIAVLFETGMRISEALGMKISKINEFDGYAQIKINGKTGEREAIFIHSWPYLKHWLNWIKDNEEMISENGKDYVWISFPKVGVEKKFHKLSGKLIDQRALNSILKKVAKKAGLNKRIHAHGLRHSSATDSASQGYNEFELRQKYGWAPGSLTASTYVHQTFQSLKDKMLFKAGKGKKPDSLDSTLIKNKYCPFCDTENPFTANYCIKCSRPLNLETLKKSEKEQSAYKFMSSLVGKLDELQKQGVDIARINEALENWVKQ